MFRPIPFLSAALLASAVFPAAAQDRAAERPSLAEPPPPPPGITDPALEPQVTIVRRGEDKVEEYRVKGKLYMLKVTPPHGTPYFLVDEQGDGSWTRRDATETGLRVPMWVILSF